jgi:putative chitinase
MDRKAFFDALRKRDSGVFGTSLTVGQVGGIEAIIDEAMKRKTPQPHLAYMLATAYHETAHTMQPIAEYGKGKGRKYGKPDGPYGLIYYGRGLVQLTWYENYLKASKETGVNLVKYPDQAMQLDVAVEIMFDGMEQGWFTTRKLADYDRPIGYDYVNARRIINGTDRAAMIAGYAQAFDKALTAAGYDPHAVPVPTPEPKPGEMVSIKVKDGVGAASGGNAVPKPEPQPAKSAATNTGAATKGAATGGAIVLGYALYQWGADLWHSFMGLFQ